MCVSFFGIHSVLCTQVSNPASSFCCNSCLSSHACVYMSIFTLSTYMNSSTNSDRVEARHLCEEFGLDSKLVLDYVSLSRRMIYAGRFSGSFFLQSFLLFSFPDAIRVLATLSSSLSADVGMDHHICTYLYCVFVAPLCYILHSHTHNPFSSATFLHF